MSLVEAPWTERQVRKIREWQQSPWVHPLTCSNRSEGHEQGVFDTDLGVLRVAADRLYCDWCAYEQHWVHDFIANRQHPLTSPFGVTESQPTDTEVSQ